jgi:hypothetical protein
MERLSLDLPALYGDHHVLKVRQLLLELPGIEDLYVSSCFRLAEIVYDPSLLDEQAIKAKLEAAGYLDDLSTPAESGVAIYGTETAQRYLRHTATYQQTGQVIGFAQVVTDYGRPLWPCPGMDVVNNQHKGEHDG